MSDCLVVVLAAGCSRRLATLTRDIPKPLLPVGHQPLLLRSLDSISTHDLRDVVITTGYHGEVIKQTLGRHYRDLNIRYVDVPSYSQSGHAWSFYCVRHHWDECGRPDILVVHGDLLFHPRLLSVALESSAPSCIVIDNDMSSLAGEELIVCGDENRIVSIVPASQIPAEPQGIVIGLNKWSSSFCGSLLRYMQALFSEDGIRHNWEPVVSKFLQVESDWLAPASTGGLAWVNVNYPRDLERARIAARSFDDL